jgi:hypothetical protein
LSAGLGAEELLHGAVRFVDGVAVIHRAGQVGVRERDPAARPVAQDVARCGPATDADEEAGLKSRESL